MIVEIILCLVICVLFSYNYYLDMEKQKKKPFPPGPWGLPIVGYLPFLGKCPAQTVAKLSKKYGKILTLKLGQYPVVFINDFDMIREVYKGDTLTGRAQLDLLVEKRGSVGLGLLEGEDWKEVKRFLLKCLRDFGFGKRSMEGSIQEELHQAINFLRKNSGKPMYLKPLIEVAVINALWYLMTSEKYDIEDPMKRKIAYIMSDGISDQNIVGVVAFLPWLAKMFPEMSGYKKGLEYLGAPEELARDIIKRHVESYSPGNERDFIDHALTKIYNTTDPKSMFYKELGMTNLHYTIIDLFFAGSDTMSSTLGYSFLYLSIWPDIQKKVHDEIDRVVGRSRIPTLVDRPNLPYLEATMSEVLRKSAMVPLGLLHTAIHDFQYRGYFFPKRTIFLSNLYHILHDPEYWGDPENFRPDRFLTPEGKYRKDDRLIPFFTGKRNCPGESLAMVEYFIFFAGIMQSFSFSLDPTKPVPDISQRPGFILPPPKHELIVTERPI